MMLTLTLNVFFFCFGTKECFVIYLLISGVHLLFLVELN